jgi:hypothetical protein
MTSKCLEAETHIYDNIKLGAVVAHWEQWWLIGSDTRL